jgi:hypothetical protein
MGAVLGLSCDHLQKSLVYMLAEWQGKEDYHFQKKFHTQNILVVFCEL